MAKHTLTQTKKIFTTTLEESERFIESIQETYGESVTKKSIQRKTKITKDEMYNYYIASVEITHNTLKELV